MNVHKKFIDVLLLERQGVLYNLISDEKDGLGLSSKSSNLFQQFEQILYTISHLEKLDLISIKRSGPNLFTDDFFNGYVPRNMVGEVSAILYLSEKMGERKSWWIEINPGLFRFRANGYMTDEGKQERTRNWITVGSVILASVLTGLFTKLFDIYL